MRVCFALTRTLRFVWESAKSDDDARDVEDELIELAFARNRTAQRKIWLAVSLRRVV